MKHVVFGIILLFATTTVLAQTPTPPPVEEGSDRTNEMELQEARRALAEAARRIAELSAVEADRIVRQFDFERVTMPRVRLGIVVADGEGHTDGVQVASVSEGGPAATAGLAAGDLLLEINGHSLAAGAERVQPPVGRIRDALAEAEPGQVVRVRYRRGRQNREASVTLEEASRAPMAFRFGYGDGPRRVIEVPPMPDMPSITMLRPLGDYEFVRVNEQLGRYFNTDKGLLVVRVGSDNPLTLEAGDVILAIGDREPQSPTQAARILRSYEPGDKVTIRIMRQRRAQTVEVTMPHPTRVSWLESWPG